MTQFKRVRGGRYVLGERAVAMKPIAGQPGKHVMVCETCGGRAAWRDLHDAGNVYGWLETHETCAPAKRGR